MYVFRNSFSQENPMTAKRTPKLGQTQRRRLEPVAAALILTLGSVAFTGCQSGSAATPHQAMGAMPVSVVHVVQKDVPLTGSWVGTMDGYVNAQIQPEVSGYLVKQNYREGQVVAKGEVLFVIDQRPFQAAVDQAQAQVLQAQGQLAQAHAQLELAQINVRRDTPLAKARAIAQSQLDTET